MEANQQGVYNGGMPDGAIAMLAPDVRAVSPEDIRHDSPDERFGDLLNARNMIEQKQREDGNVYGIFDGERIPESIMRGDWGQNDRGIEDMVRRGARTPMPGAQPYPGEQTAPPGFQPQQPWMNAQTYAPGDQPGGQAQPYDPYAQQRAMQQRQQQFYQQPTIDQLNAMRQEREIAELRGMVTNLVTAMQRPNDPYANDPDAAMRQLTQSLYGRRLADDELQEPPTREELARAIAVMSLEDRQHAANLTQDVASRFSAPAVDPMIESLVLRDNPLIAEVGDPSLRAKLIAREAQRYGGGGQPSQPQGAFAYGMPMPSASPAPPSYGYQAPRTPAYGQGPYPNPQGLPTMRAATFVERGVPYMEVPPNPVPPAAQAMNLLRSGQHLTTEQMAKALRQHGIDVGNQTRYL